jgi:hypothetical protein
MVALSVSRLTDVTEVAQQTALKGRVLIKSAFNWGRERGIDVKRNMVEAITKGRKDSEIRNAMPESSAAVLLGIMEVPEENDFDAILAILRPAGQHELKSILRRLSEMELDRNDPLYAEKQGEALQEGINRLFEFGHDKFGVIKQNYLKELYGILQRNNITF